MVNLYGHSLSMTRTRNGDNDEVTIEMSNAAIADPCDRPITPSYWFFDNSSDHHFTCKEKQGQPTPTPHVVQHWTEHVNQDKARTV
jgi:hypothetical protein